MKRLRVILLFLLLGAVVNIAVAWGCAIYAYINMFVETDHGNTSDPGFSSDTGACWLFTRADFFGSTLLNGRAIIEADRKDTHLWLVEYYSPLGEVPPIPAWSQFAHPPTLYKSLFEESEGLPFRTLFWLEAYNEWPTKYITYDGRKHVWAVRVYSNDVNLPLAPIWIGLLLNTIFYASLLWLMFSGPFVFRRLIRRKRGLCVKCAYDLRGADHESCPECGEAIRKGNPA